ncbi:MAG: hypothetical protein ACP5OA_06495 [Candidatus Woesearchaeota archaeon]
MNKGIVLVAILVVTIFLTGCGQTTSSTPGKAFLGGTEGLRTTFLTGTPPEKITDGGSSTFNMVVKIDNAGESDVNVNDGYVQVWGLDAGTYRAGAYPDFRTGFTEPLRGAIKGYDGGVINGDTSTVEFEDLSYLPTIQGDLQQVIWTNICYRYTTKVATQLCIKNNAEQALGGAEICSVEGEKYPQNSGAPIHVTSIKESYAGTNRIGLTLTISHVGNGDAFFRDDSLDCNNVESNNDRGKVRVTFSPISMGGRNDIQVVCPSLTDGYIRLFGDGNRATQTLYCTIDITGTNNVVQVPLNLELSYVYLQHIEKQMTIRHVSQ